MLYTISSMTCRFWAISCFKSSFPFDMFLLYSINNSLCCLCLPNSLYSYWTLPSNLVLSCWSWHRSELSRLRSESIDPIPCSLSLTSLCFSLSLFWLADKLYCSTNCYCLAYLNLSAVYSRSPCTSSLFSFCPNKFSFSFSNRSSMSCCLFLSPFMPSNNYLFFLSLSPITVLNSLSSSSLRFKTPPTSLICPFSSFFAPSSSFLF